MLDKNSASFFKTTETDKRFLKALFIPATMGILALTAVAFGAFKEPQTPAYKEKRIAPTRML